MGSPRPAGAQHHTQPLPNAHQGQAQMIYLITAWLAFVIALYVAEAIIKFLAQKEE